METSVVLFVPVLKHLPVNLVHKIPHGAPQILRKFKMGPFVVPLGVLNISPQIGLARYLAFMGKGNVSIVSVITDKHV